jgi:NADPH:quinone reductase-like Zn-dependent oxidoreductase
MDLVFEGKLKPVMDRDYPLMDARFAQEQLEKGEQLGKITLTIG